MIASEALSQLTCYDLAQPLAPGIPSSPNHPGFKMAMLRRHGDRVREDGGSAANELIVTGGHVGTHVDALGHVSHQGLLFGGASAADAQTGGSLRTHGIDELAPIVCRGVLLDVPAALGLEALPPAHPVTPEQLDAAASLGAQVQPGDVALVRTGWAARFDDAEAYIGHETGVPGPTEAAARHLAAQGVRATGADTIAYEHIPPGAGHRALPAHRVLLVERGIHIIEVLNLEELSRERVYEFVFVLAPLKILGATGSPVRPLALADRAER